MTYPSLISKDLPMIVWSLDDATVTAGSAIANDGYLSSTYNGTYLGTISKKSVPIIQGSSQSVIVSAGNANGFGLAVPSMGMFSYNRRNAEMSFEFWFKLLDTADTSSRTAIVQKSSGTSTNSPTGIYIHNSSIIAVVGDTSGNTEELVLPIQDIYRPMNIIFSHGPKSFSLIVNGNAVTKEFDNSRISQTYSATNDLFRFMYSSALGKYALDNIAIYSRVISIPESRKHLAYGLGYEIPQQIPSYFGGKRYSLSMNTASVSGKIDIAKKDWMRKDAKIYNMLVDKNGMLSVDGSVYPELKFATNYSISTFSWTSSGLKCGLGGYVEINKPYSLSDSQSCGISAVFNKVNTENIPLEEKAYLMNVTDSSAGKELMGIKFYIEGTSSGEDLYVQINNESPNKFASFSGGINADFVVGYFYDKPTDTITAFFGASGSTATATYSQSNSTTNGRGLLPISSTTNIRFFSNNTFSDKTEYYTDSHFFGSLKKIVQLDSLPTGNAGAVYTNITSSSKFDRYVATASPSTSLGRFIVKTKGLYEFYTSLRSLCRSDAIIGINNVEFGSSSPEITVTATGTGAGSEETWLASPETLYNNKPFIGIIGQDPGNTKAVKITIDIICTDATQNPTKIPYFRIISYRTTEDASIYSTSIGEDEPKITLQYNSSTKDDFIIPSFYSTPFLYNRERDGIKVGRTAKINYSSPMISSVGTAGFNAVSMFINIDSTETNRGILNIKNYAGTTLYNIVHNHSAGTSTITATTGTVSISLNGATPASSVTITRGQWQHLLIILGTRVTTKTNEPASIEFGSTTSVANMYIDEIMVLDTVTSSHADMIFKSHTGNYKQTVSAVSSANISIKDKEISNSTSVYQTLNTQTSVLNPVVASSVYNRAYTTSGSNITYAYSTVDDLVYDGWMLQVGDRVLIKDISSGQSIAKIYKVASIDESTSLVTFSPEADTVSTGTFVYVTNGNINGKTFFVYNGTSWAKTIAQDKVVSYSINVNSPTLNIRKSTIISK